MTREEICTELDVIAKQVIDKIAVGEDITDIGAEIAKGAVDLTYKNLKQMHFIRAEIERRVIEVKKLQGV